jgi:hypothetical protein
MASSRCESPLVGRFAASYAVRRNEFASHLPPGALRILVVADGVLLFCLFSRKPQGECFQATGDAAPKRAFTSAPVWPSEKPVNILK